MQLKSLQIPRRLTTRASFHQAKSSPRPQIIPSPYTVKQSSLGHTTKPLSPANHHPSHKPHQTTTPYTIARKMSTITTTSPPTFPPASLQEILNEVTTLLKSRNETLSVAETASGGLISASILSSPGASKIYAGGLTLYTLASRIAYAGWSEENLKTYKGPTPEIVAGLASHVRGELKSSYTIAESGTAGPTGGEPRNRRPGYVALAVCSEHGCWTREVETGLGGERSANMVRFAEEGLRLLRDVIKGEAKGEEKL